MYVNFLSTYSDKKSCHTSTTLQTSIAQFVSDSWASCFVLIFAVFSTRFYFSVPQWHSHQSFIKIVDVFDLYTPQKPERSLYG